MLVTGVKIKFKSVVATGDTSTTRRITSANFAMLSKVNTANTASTLSTIAFIHGFFILLILSLLRPNLYNILMCIDLQLRIYMTSDRRAITRCRGGLPQWAAAVGRRGGPPHMVLASLARGPRVLRRR